MMRLQDQARTNLAIQALALLTTAEAPLTADAVCHALAIAQILDNGVEPSELDHDEIPNSLAVVECCMGLITIDPTTRDLTLAHADIAQHIRKQWHEIFGDAQMSKIARICIAYLSLTAFSIGPCSWYENSALSQSIEKYPFLDYASHHWGYHARRALPLHKDLSGYIKQLLRKRENVLLALQVSKLCAQDVVHFLENKPDWVMVVDAGDLESTSSLQLATRYGLSRVAKDVIDIDPETISQQDWLGISPLHEAAKAGWLDLVRMLLDAGAQASLATNNGRSPLYFAAENGHFDIASVLLARSGLVYSQKIRSPIVEAARNGHYRIVSLLKDHSQPSEVEEAFCDAAVIGERDVIEQLLKDQISPDTRNNGTSALMNAIRCQNEEIVHMLLKAGASFNCNEHAISDDIPLHQAIKYGRINKYGRLGVAELLLDWGANIQARDNLKRNALFESFKRLEPSDFSGANVLLNNGINISCQDYEGNTVLHRAAQLGYDFHALCFVDQGINTDITNHKGLTPLDLARICNQFRVVEMLNRKGAAGGIYDSPDLTFTILHNLETSKLLQEASKAGPK